MPFRDRGTTDIKIEGKTLEEVELMCDALAKVFDVVNVSGPYRNRDGNGYRGYVNIKIRQKKIALHDIEDKGPTNKRFIKLPDIHQD